MPLKPKTKQAIKTTAKWVGLGWLTVEVYMAAVVRRQKRRDTFNLALQKAQATGKQLIVVGAPERALVNRMLGADFDCGDMCIDPRGCGTCPNQGVGTVEEVLPTLGTNSAVIFVSNTLEHVTDMPKVVSELKRVSGGDLFVTYLEPWTVAAWSPFNKRRILKAPPSNGAHSLTYKDHWWTPGQSLVKELPTG